MIEKSTLINAPLRLEFGDDLFVRRHRIGTTPAINQFAWRFDTPLDDAAVDRFHRRLALGALARRVDRPWVPGARKRWSRTEAAHPMHRARSALSDADVLPWLHAQAATDLDPTKGAAWRLAHAETTNGGAVLTLTVAHAVADGAMLLDAVRRAATDENPLRVPLAPGRVRALIWDLRDAAQQLRVVASWAGRKLRNIRLPRSTTRSSDRTSKRPAVNSTPAPVSQDWTIPHVVVECATEELTVTAVRRGGSVNSLFAAALARIARAAAGEETTTTPLAAALPVSARTGVDDPRANSTKIAAAQFDAAALRDRDLAVLKAECKRAFAAVNSPSPQAVPLALIQMLPDAVVRRFPAPPAATVLASSVGAPPEPFREIAGATARSVAGTAHYPGIDATEAATIGRGVLGWLTITGETTTLSVCGLDPTGIPDRARLQELLTTELAGWGIEAKPW